MNIVLFTGLSASGKTTIATKVAQELEIPVVNLHELLRSLILQERFPKIREWISHVGIEQALVESRVVLIAAMEVARNTRGMIVDEVLDPQTLSALKDRFPEDQIITVYIRTNRHDRKHWMLNRLDKASEIRAIDRMKVQAGKRNYPGSPFQGL